MAAVRPVADRHSHLGAEAGKVRSQDLCYVLPLDFMPPEHAG